MANKQKVLVILNKCIQARLRNARNEAVLATELCELYKSGTAHISRHVVSRAVRDAFNMHWKQRVLKASSLEGVWPVDEEYAMQKLVNDICKETQTSNHSKAAQF